MQADRSGNFFVSKASAFRGVLAAGLLLVLSSPAAQAKHAGDDWQYWNEFDVQKKLSEEWTIRGHSEQWLRDNITDLYYYNFEGGALYSPSRFIDFGPFYRYEQQKSDKGRIVSNNQYYLEITPKYTIRKFQLSNRGRIEYNDRNVGSDYWRYRNRVKIAYPLKFAKVAVSPYVSDEFFWDITNHSVNQNRFGGGLAWKLSKHVTFTTYYLWRTRLAGAIWKSEQVIGTALGFNF